MSNGPTYTFVDGGYLQTQHARLLELFFGMRVAAKLDLALVREGIGGTKVFYYDCLDDLPHEGEAEADRQARIDAQVEEFDRAQAIPGFHVRYGTLSGGTARRRRQKEIDVLLAVDMLTHAYARNMEAVTLLSGDLDFKPAVEALIRLGRFVEIACVEETTAQDLLAAADERRLLTLRELYDWTTLEFRRGHPIPLETYGTERLHARRVIRRGTIRGIALEHYADPDGMQSFFIERGPMGAIRVDDRDLRLLERYFAIVHGQPDWQ